MKILVLNLPYKRKIIRKYSCSYYGNGFLYPPVELLRVCTILREKSSISHEIVFIDAIAENLNYLRCNDKVTNLNPDIIITLASVDFINDEYTFLSNLKKANFLKIILIGYIPNLFPQSFKEANVILGNNFEQVIGKAIAGLKSNNSDEFILLCSEISLLKPGFNPDIIDYHDTSFSKIRLYSELFVKGKTAFTYFSFGCPYKCSFCLKTYNLEKVYFRNFENIFTELKSYWNSGIKNIRILDDNCTINKSFLKKLLEFHNSTGIKFHYYGLSRIDLLDNETITLLAALNFRSILIGIESINSSTQKQYNKKLDFNFEKIKRILKQLKLNNIEATLFFLFNPVGETRIDILNTLRILNKLPVNYASLTFLLPYPGTTYFNDNIEKIDFSLDSDYSSSFKKEYYKNLRKWELLFIFSFYFHKPQRLLFYLKKLIFYPLPFTKILFSVIKFALFRQKNRKDYF